MQKAPRLVGFAAAAVREKPPKWPSSFDGRSKKTLKQHRKHQEDHEKKGFLPVFDYITHIKEKAQ